jgi:hypothetical protein
VLLALLFLWLFALFALSLSLPNEPVIGSPNGRCFLRGTSNSFLQQEVLLGKVGLDIWHVTWMPTCTGQERVSLVCTIAAHVTGRVLYGFF